MCKSCRSRQELSNKHLVAKFGVDTAEPASQPRTGLSKFAKNLPKVRNKFEKNIGADAGGAACRKETRNAHFFGVKPHSEMKNFGRKYTRFFFETNNEVK